MCPPKTVGRVCPSSFFVAHSSRTALALPTAGMGLAELLSIVSQRGSAATTMAAQYLQFPWKPANRAPKSVVGVPCPGFLEMTSTDLRQAILPTQNVLLIIQVTMCWLLERVLMSKSHSPKPLSVIGFAPNRKQRHSLLLIRMRATGRTLVHAWFLAPLTKNGSHRGSLASGCPLSQPLPWLQAPNRNITQLSSTSFVCFIPLASRIRYGNDDPPVLGLEFSQAMHAQLGHVGSGNRPGGLLHQLVVHTQHQLPLPALQNKTCIPIVKDIVGGGGGAASACCPHPTPAPSLRLAEQCLRFTTGRRRQEGGGGL